MLNTSEYLKNARIKRHGYPDWFLPESVDHVMDALKDVTLCHGLETLKSLEDLTISTAISPKAYKAFQKDGVYKTLWETGPTWHYQFSKDPQGGRQYNDRRLFGIDKAIHTSYAALILPPDMAKHMPMRLAPKKELYGYMNSYSGKGGLIIQWKPQVLNDASFCYGDCQQNPMVHPFSIHNLNKYIDCFTFMKIIDSEINEIPGPKAVKGTEPIVNKLIKNILSGQYGGPAGVIGSLRIILSDTFNDIVKNPYFEVQIHRQLTPDDVASAQ